MNARGVTARPPADPAGTLGLVADIVVITGLSGAGRSHAAADLEDQGWYVVDNLPTSLVRTIVDLASMPGAGIDRLALVVGTSPQQADILGAIETLRAGGHRVRIIYLEAATPELVKRYGSTRRRHPLGEDTSLLDAIARERELLEPVKAMADVVVDTTGLTIHQLKSRLTELFAVDAAATGMQTAVVSFGYKHGLPLDVDIVLDCRFLPNPFWEERLRPLTGLDEPVRAFVLGQPEAGPFIDRVEDLLTLLVPAFEREGKSYLTIAFGCTGGQHRSVTVAEEVAARLRRRGMELRVQHRDLPR
jgi:RNase adapter protein RapZ